MTSKIVFLDIETFPNLAYVWGTYKQTTLEVVEHTRLCSYSAKWLGGEHITRALPDFPKYKATSRDDTQLIKELWHIIDEADTVVAHYGDGFDIPTMRACFARIGLQPPTPFKSVDTKKVASKLFYFGGSNSLAHICSYLGLGKKMDTGGWELWRNCIAGDKESWAKMRKYNAHDVTLLEKLYYYLRPWISDHPHVSEIGCPKCGSQNLQSRGTQRTTTRTYQRYQCTSCGGWSRSTKSISSSHVTNA